MSGWVKLHRIIHEWEWYKDSQMVHLFIHLITSANHEDKKWQGITIKRGQLLTGRFALSEALGISQQSIRTCLSRLKSTNEITIKVTNKFSIITVCKYDSYQTNDGEINQQINQPVNQQLTNNQPTTNQQVTTNKNIRSKEVLKTPKILKNEVAPFVHLSEAELADLILKYGQDGARWMIDKLSLYKESVGKKYLSDSAAIRSWVVKEWDKEKLNKQTTKLPY